jgi:hypothetical protein
MQWCPEGTDMGDSYLSIRFTEVERFYPVESSLMLAVCEAVVRFSSTFCLRLLCELEWMNIARQESLYSSTEV